MEDLKSTSEELGELRSQLKALANRYSIEILQVLSPKTGEIIPNLGWDNIVVNILHILGYPPPKNTSKDVKTQYSVEYAEVKKKFASGGTLYESMNKIVKAGFVQASGEKGKKQRKFMITHSGRLALSAVHGMLGPIASDTEVKRTARILLRYKNYVRLLPAQRKFLNEVGDIEGNLIIQMPPGSGKTFLAMIAILINLQKGKRCLYASPYLSIIRQVIEEYGELFKELGYSMIRHDGYYRASEADLKSADLIVAVYETALMGILQRKEWTEEFGLVVVDELTEIDSWVSKVRHNNLGTDRSTKLDCLTTLLKRKAQIITLSARFGNTEEVAEWLDAEVFRPSVRMVPDEHLVFLREEGIGIHSCDGTQNAVFKTENDIEAVLQHLDDYEEKSVLFVVSFRMKSEFLARFLSTRHPRIINKDIVNYVVGQDGELPIIGRLKEILEKGIAFHHAGVNARVRARLEEKIKTGGIRTVVSTTGITAGTSFPFDCVIIIHDAGMAYLQTRSRYLQIAGRIGEYHLAKYGGRVYLIFQEPSRTYNTPAELQETFLHRPLTPLNSGVLYPALVANLMMREVVMKRKFKQETIEKNVSEIASATFRSMVDEKYLDSIKEMVSKLFEWFIDSEVIEKSSDDYKLSKDFKAAVLAGLDIIKYISVRNLLLELDYNTSEETLIDLLMNFDIPQSIRPKSLIPTEIELQLMGIPPVKDWYAKFVEARERIKRYVIGDWIKEATIANMMPKVIQLSHEVRNGKDPVSGSDLDEGDIDILVVECSNLANNLSIFFRSLKKLKLGKRMEILSNQLRYGIKADLAEFDLMELMIHQDNAMPVSRIERTDARILYDNGYRTISEVVRNDLDAKKKGLARERFAENSGLDLDYAIDVYKSALAHIRAKFDDDDDE
ncbi:MAG: DEAD/DEAH box helicase [Candidatus Thorarchaeota archaeon]